MRASMRVCSEQRVKERRLCEPLLGDARQLVSGLEDRIMVHQSENRGNEWQSNEGLDVFAWHAVKYQLECVFAI